MTEINTVDRQTFAIPEVVRTWLGRDHGLIIDGKSEPASSGKTIAVENPATRETVAHVAEAGAADVARAVQSARQSFDSGVWRKMQVDQRARVMWKLADLLEADVDLIATILTLENGMPRPAAARSVMGAAGWIRTFSGAMKRIGGRSYGSAISAPGEWHTYTRPEPVGVVGLITPWNGPIGTVVIKAAPALAAGCSLVVKPSELTPLACLRLGELALEAGLPPGVLNIVPGYGADAGEALAAHPDVNKISFTGSTAVGKHIVRTATGNLKRVTLELGGKSPCVVFDDADLDIAIPGAAMAVFMNSGQACLAGSRLFIQRKVFDKVIAGIAEVAGKLRLGNGLADNVDLGPLISAKHRDRVTSYIHSGIEEGAEVVAGGGWLDDPGYFVQPTLFVNTQPHMKIVQEEIFGPVIAATVFDDMEQIVPYANATNYGLASGVFTTNINKAHKLAARINAGSVYVNCYGMFDPAMPFGGFKESGWGRELGEEGLSAYLETKSVFVSLG